MSSITSENKSFIQSLRDDFTKRPETVLEYTQRAMVRGTVHEGIQVPQFVVAIKAYGRSPISRAQYLHVGQIEESPHDGFENGAVLRLQTHGRDGTEKMEIQHKELAGLSDLSILRTAVEAKPLTIDQKIASLLLEDIFSDTP